MISYNLTISQSHNLYFTEGVIIKIKNMKKFIFLTVFAAFTLLLDACGHNYVATQPTEIETVRPPRLNNDHIWIDGNWVYRRQTRAYSRNRGYWVTPRRSHTYMPGQWQSTPRGLYWRNGRWQ
jgi:hypothetical protein